jgi:pyruvate kinase
MKNQTERLFFVKEKIDSIISKVREMELLYTDELNNVHPVYQKSALNLVHYLAFRSFDIDELQEDLRDLGLTSLSNIESHVMRSLLSMSWILNQLLGHQTPEVRKGIISFKKSEKILRTNTKLMFGYNSIFSNRTVGMLLMFAFTITTGYIIHSTTREV